MAYGYGYGRPVRLSAPVSVHMIAILQYLGGLIGLVIAALVAAAALAGSRVLDDPGVPAAVQDAVTGSGTLVAAVVAAISVFAIVIGRKLQRGRQWARVLLLLVSALDLVGAGYAVLARDMQAPGLSAFAGPVLYILLLNTRAARSWFRYGTY